VIEDRLSVAANPVHRAVWTRGVTLQDFDSMEPVIAPAIREVMSRSLAAVRRHKESRSLYGTGGSIAPAVIAELGAAGYWGLRASVAHGGAGANLQTLVQFIRDMTAVDPWVAGMMSIHACIGPVALLEAFGNPEQKDRLLPPLVTGQRLGAFAVTEPGTSSDWKAIRTTARREGDRLLVSGQKAFITNAGPGRTVGVLCLIDGRHEMVLIELAPREDERFRTVAYSGLKAFAHIGVAGLVFNELPVPAANVLEHPRGDGRAIAHHALNAGRVALCASSAGALRMMAGSLIPWVQQRQTFGTPIGSRELIQRRLGWLASRIVACDAMVAWTARLLDEGYRGEFECVTAKVFGSESVKEATVDVLLKTHGGRALFEGNLFSDALFDLLGPTIGEGENEILTLGSFQSLAQEHAERYLAPIAAAMKGGEGETGKQRRALDLWDVSRHTAAYGAWVVGEEVHHAMGRLRHRLTDAPDALAHLALDLLADMALEISAALRHFGAAIAQRQVLAFELERRVQLATVMLVVSRYAERQQDPLVRQAGICAALELGTQLTGSRPTGHMHHLITELGLAVAEDRFAPVAGADRGSVAMVAPA